MTNGGAKTRVCEDCGQPLADCEPLATLSSTDAVLYDRRCTARAATNLESGLQTGDRCWWRPRRDHICTPETCGHLRQLDALVDVLGMPRGSRSVLDEVRHIVRVVRPDGAPGRLLHDLQAARRPDSGSDTALLRQLTSEFADLTVDAQLALAKHFSRDLVALLMPRMIALLCPTCGGTGYEPNDTGESVFDGDPCSTCRPASDGEATP